VKYFPISVVAKCRRQHGFAVVHTRCRFGIAAHARRSSSCQGRRSLLASCTQVSPPNCGARRCQRMRRRGPVATHQWPNVWLVGVIFALLKQSPDDAWTRVRTTGDVPAKSKSMCRPANRINSTKGPFVSYRRARTLQPVTCRDENGPERTEKPLFYFYFYIFNGNRTRIRGKMELKTDEDI
jgi:hypothetical protein